MLFNVVFSWIIYQIYLFFKLFKCGKWHAKLASVTLSTEKKMEEKIVEKWTIMVMLMLLDGSIFWQNLMLHFSGGWTSQKYSFLFNWKRKEGGWMDGAMNWEKVNWKKAEVSCGQPGLMECEKNVSLSLNSSFLFFQSESLKVASFLSTILTWRIRYGKKSC